MLADGASCSGYRNKAFCYARNGINDLVPKADICSAIGHVRFTPNSDIDCAFRHIRFAPKADTKF
jgi:hypothetical protein